MIEEEVYIVNSRSDEKIKEIVAFDFRENESVIVLTNYALYRFTNEEPDKPEVIDDYNECF